MISGGCPYCDASVWLPMPDKTPAFSHEECDECGRTFWEYYSRIAPEAFTEEAFAERFVADEATKQITPRNATVV